jgi:hypothetical protein
MCGGFCPAHAPYNRFRVVYHYGFKQWVVIAPYGTGKGKKSNSFLEAIAYADMEARR